MTTLANRPKTALLIIDMQRGVVEHAHERSAVIANIATLLISARNRMGSTAARAGSDTRFVSLRVSGGIKWERTAMLQV